MPTRKAQVKRKLKALNSDRILWIGLVFFMVPVLIIGVILLQSSLGTGKVIAGNRFAGDLDPAITQELLTEAETKAKEVTGVESATLTLKAATLVATVKVSDSLDPKDFSTTTEAIAAKITAVLPVSTYFTKTDTKKMYDLQLDVYNNDPADTTKVKTHVILTKNANMTSWTVQDVSTALNPTLAEELRAAVEAKNNPSGSSLPSGSSEQAGDTTTTQ